MKKLVLLMLIIVMSFLTPSVHATPPIMPGTFDVKIKDCQSYTGDDEIFFDLLITESSFWGEFFSDRVINEYRSRFPNYETFDFLEIGEYKSYSAYVRILYYSLDEDCTVHLETDIADEADVYFIVFKGDGTLLYQEKYNVSDLGYSSDYKYYTTLIYDISDNLAFLSTKRRFGIGTFFILLGVGSIIVVTLCFIGLFLLIKKLVRR